MANADHGIYKYLKEIFEEMQAVMRTNPKDDDWYARRLAWAIQQERCTLPGVVQNYNASTRRATVKISLRHKVEYEYDMDENEPIISEYDDNGYEYWEDYPLLIDVPVQYPGTKKFTIHFPLETDDEVAVFFSGSCLELWKQTGMYGIEDPNPRQFALQDAFCTPGLQPIQFIPATNEGALQIIHKTAWNGDFISHVVMDDNKVEMKYKENATVLIEDDHIKANSEKCAVDMAGDHLKASTEKCAIDMAGNASNITAPIVSINGGQGASRINDTVEVTIPAGTVLVPYQNGGVASYQPNQTPIILQGKITGGSSKCTIS